MASPSHLASSSHLDWAPLNHAGAEPVRVGDLVSADAGGMPIYCVIAVEPGRAWVAANPSAPARAMPLDGFRWRGVGELVKFEVASLEAPIRT